MSGLDSGQDEGGYGDAGSGYDSGTSDFGGGSEPDFGAGGAMLDLGLLETFNGMTSFPSDDKVLKAAGTSVEEYKQKVAKLYGTQ